jgi:hypothetical protein
MTPPQPLFTPPYAAGFSTANDTVTLLSSLLAVDTPYTFALRVLRPAPGRLEGAVPSVAVSTTVVRRDRSLLKMTTIAPVAVRRPLSLSLDALVAVCAQSDALPDTSLARRLLASPLAGLVYQWSQLDGPTLSTSATSYDQVRLSLPPYTLTTFATYTFGVLVTSIDSTIVPAHANVTFDVLPSTPVALIAGSQYRPLAYDAELTLDASPSLDPDYPDQSSSALAFFWPFPTLQADTPVTPACQAQHDSFIFTWITLDVTSSKLVLPAQANLLCAGLEYRFTVVVSHADLPAKFANTPTSSTFTVVVADAEPVPPVSDTMVQSLVVVIAPLDADRFVLDAFPPGEKLRLQATVAHTIVTYSGVLQQTPGGILTTAVVETSRVEDTHTDIDIEGGYRLVYRWSETHAFFDARDASNLAGAPDVSSLILGTGILSPSLAGIVTTLRLDVTLVSPSGVTEATAFSKLDVTLNAPPTVELASIDATSGTAGATRFAVECVGAADPDEPLTFAFAYAFFNAPTELFPLTDRIFTPRADVLLPVGSVFVVCYAFDSFGAQSLPSMATPRVTVTLLLYLIEYNANATCSPSLTLVELLAPAVLAQQSIVVSLQQINSYFSSILAEDCATLDCGVYDIFVTSIASLATTAAANNELNDATAQQLSSALASITQNSTIGACPEAFAAAAATIADIISAVNAANTGTNSSAPIGDQDGLSKGGAETVIESLSGSLSSLISSAGCEQFDSLTSLVVATLAASSAGSIAGEATDGIETDSIKATTTRVNGATSSTSNSAVTPSSGGSGVQFDFPVESVTGLACADIQIVEYAAPTAVACRANAASASVASSSGIENAQDDTSGTATGLDRPASTIVEADIVDCAGNVIDVANLTVPISFLVPLAEDALLAPSTITTKCADGLSYLPNDGVVESKNVVVEKEVECSFFDTATQQWSSDGCVVADYNVTQADGSRAIRCECTHLTEFAILLREKGRDDATSCNISPASVFGSILFLIFACLFSLLLAVGARQTYSTIWAFGLYEQKTMLAQHMLLCLICIFRIVVCVIYYELQHASVRADIEFKAVAAISGLPYIFMLWLFSLLVVNWASIYYAAKRNDLGGVGNAFQTWRPYFIGGNVVGTVLLGSLFITIALSEDAKVRSKVTLSGSSIYSIVVFAMSIAFAFFGFGLMVQLSKDFKSQSAQRICKVGMIFCACFVGEAVIWLMSGVSPDAFFANFEVVNSVFFSLDLVALVCILFVTKKTLAMGVDDKRDAHFKPTMQKTTKNTLSRSRAAQLSRSNANNSGSASSAGAPGSVTLKTQRGGLPPTPTSPLQANRLRLKRSASKRFMSSSRSRTMRSGTRASAMRASSKLSKMLLRSATSGSVATASLDPDDPRYDGAVAADVASAAAAAAAASLDVYAGAGGKRGSWQPAPPARVVNVNVRAFTSENKFGETVIDMGGVERRQSAVNSAAEVEADVSASEPSVPSTGEEGRQEQVTGRFQHWFETLSISSSLSSLSSSNESFMFSEDSSPDGDGDGDGDELAWLIDSSSVDTDSVGSVDESLASSSSNSFYDATSISGMSSLSGVSSLSSLSFSAGSSDTLSSRSGGAVAAVFNELRALLGEMGSSSSSNSRSGTGSSEEY